MEFRLGEGLGALVLVFVILMYMSITWNQLASSAGKIFCEINNIKGSSISFKIDTNFARYTRKSVEMSTNWSCRLKFFTIC